MTFRIILIPFNISYPQLKANPIIEDDEHARPILVFTKLLTTSGLIISALPIKI